MNEKQTRTLSRKRKAPLNVPTRLASAAVKDISAALTSMLADTFTLYLKTKNFHWHPSGPHFRDYHRMLDEQSDELIGMTDDMAKRARKTGGTTLRSIGPIARLKRIADNDADYVDPTAMLAELLEDNNAYAARLVSVHEACDEHGDVATASLIELWIDQTEKRAWFLFEATRTGAH